MTSRAAETFDYVMSKLKNQDTADPYRVMRIISKAFDESGFYGSGGADGSAREHVPPPHVPHRAVESDSDVVRRDMVVGAQTFKIQRGFSPKR